MRFSGKTIFITGAGAGIGRAAAEGLAAEGGRVIATDANPDALADLARGAGRIEAAALDVTDAQAVAALGEGAGEIDILFNCAGVVAHGSILETTRADWDRSFQVNVTGMFEVTRAILPGMLRRKHGVILNVASICSSLKGLPHRFAYGATKAAVIGLTKSIAIDYVTEGIRCNAICPGTVDTPSLRQRLRDTGDYDAALIAFTARQPMGRLATAEEIAAMVLYLASDDAAFITGQAIAIDGGITI